MKPSHASTGYHITCNAVFGAGTPGVKISFKVVYKNIGTASSPSTLSANVLENSQASGAGGYAASKTLPVIAAGHSYTWQGYTPAYTSNLNPFTLRADMLTNRGIATICTGSRNYPY